MGSFPTFWCDECANGRRFIYRATSVDIHGHYCQVRALVVQEQDGVYMIAGASELEEGKGPAPDGMAHLYCGICGTNMAMAVYDMKHDDIKGWKGIEVFDNHED